MTDQNETENTEKAESLSNIDEDICRLLKKARLEQTNGYFSFVLTDGTRMSATITDILLYKVMSDINSLGRALSEPQPDGDIDDS